MDDTNPNLALFLREMPTETEWQGRKTVKPFKKGGGFSGTALDAMYVVARLTHAFGPVGIGWGYTVVSERTDHAAAGTDGKLRSNHYAVVRFWYVHDGVRGEFDEIGGTPVMGFGDDDAGKKSVTDAITKAASRLGFGADVHLGKFDDNKYVETRDAETKAGQRLAAANAKGALRAEARTLRLSLDDTYDLETFRTLFGQAVTLRQKLEAAGLQDEIDSLGDVVANARARTAPPRQAAE